jgi:hypothetical protein
VIPARLASLVAALAAVAVACTSAPQAKIPEPPSVPATTTTLPPFDFSKTIVAAVETAPGTTTTVPLIPGTLTISGRATGPDGLLPQATVRLQRFVGNESTTIDVLTDDTGTFKVVGVAGGRWKIRAWRAPDLVTAAPSVVFLVNDTPPEPLDLRMVRRSGTVVTPSLAPVPLPLGAPASLAVLVSTQSVDAQGIVRSAPQPFVTVELVGTGAWRVNSENPTLADESGTARWSVRCIAEGTQPLSVLVDNAATYALELPRCGLPPTTTSSTTPGATTRPSGPRGTTTTTRR